MDAENDTNLVRIQLEKKHARGAFRSEIEWPVRLLQRLRFERGLPGGAILVGQITRFYRHCLRGDGLRNHDVPQLHESRTQNLVTRQHRAERGERMREAARNGRTPERHHVEVGCRRAQALQYPQAFLKTRQAQGPCSIQPLDRGAGRRRTATQNLQQRVLVLTDSALQGLREATSRRVDAQAAGFGTQCNAQRGQVVNQLMRCQNSISSRSSAPALRAATHTAILRTVGESNISRRVSCAPRLS